jgi:gliding motility-associated-like protein
MMIRYLLFLAFLTLPIALIAQVSSDDGFFTVPEDKACAPYIPVVTAPLCLGGGCTFFPDANDATTARQLVSGQPIPDFEYQPGTWQMKVVIGNDPATQIIDFLTVNIYDATAPAFNFFICSSNRIQLEILDTKYPEYRIDYDNDNTADDNSPTGMVTPPFQYAPGQSGLPQTINVRGNYPNCLTAQVTATPGNFAPTTPVINELEVLNTNDLALTLATTDNYYYELEMSTNSPSGMLLRQRVGNEKALNITGLNPENNYYCFRIGVVDICSSPAATYGNTICSADLNLSVQPDVMKLAWSTSNSGVFSFALSKTPGLAIGLPPSALSYDDTDIGCGTTYTYQLTNEYGSGIRSISRAYSGTAISNKVPSVIDNVTSVVTENSVELTWLQDPTFTPETYTIYRVINNIARSAGTSTTPNFTDNSYITGEHYCYQIEYKDVCGKQSPRSAVVCPIEMTGELEKDNEIALSWSAYNGWAIGVDHYQVEKYATDGSLVDAVNNGLATTYTDPVSSSAEQIYIYRVHAISADGAVLPLPSISNAITIIKNPNLSHPTAFVPGSQIEDNQTFRVFGNYIDTFELRIFNRWGELLFESFDKDQGWDGMYNGQRMPEGTYVFMVKIKDLAGRNFDYGGTVVLLKKG